MRWLREFGPIINTIGSVGLPAFGKALAWHIKVLGWTVLQDYAPPIIGTGVATHVGSGNIQFHLTSGGPLQIGLHNGHLITTSGSANPLDHVSNAGVTITDRYDLNYFNGNDPLLISPSVGMNFTLNNPLMGWAAGLTLAGGTTGEWNISGSDFQFRVSTGAPFYSGLVGRPIVIGGNERTSGVYRVTSFIDANNITVGYLSGATEYPDQQTGLDWTIYRDDPLDMIANGGSVFEAQSPGTTPWRIRIEFQFNSSLTHTFNVFVAAGTDWSQILTAASINLPVGSTARGYSVGDDDNLSILMYDETLATYYAALFGLMRPVEARSAIEKIFSVGGSSPIRPRSVYSMDEIWGQITHNFLEPSYGPAVDGLSMWTSRQRNSRISGSTAGVGTGDSIAMAGSVATLTDAGATFFTSDVGRKIRVSGCTNGPNNGLFTVTARLSSTQIQFTNALGVNETSAFEWSMDHEDLAIGSLVVTDPNNVSSEYSIMGRLGGFYSTRKMSNRFAFSDEDYLDRFHWNDGISFPWPKVTPQY